MKYRFVLYPQHVVSIYDGDRHWISAGRLRSLYNVPRGAKCITVETPEDYGSLIPQPNDIHLRHRTEGNYPDIMGQLGSIDACTSLLESP